MAKPRLSTRIKKYVVRRLPVLERAQRFLYKFKPYAWKFRTYYVDHAWGGSASRSGPGSSLGQTAAVRARLPALFSELSIRSMVDVPCGDFFWMREVPLGNVQYLGLDIVDELIADNRKQYGKPGIEFARADMIEDLLPRTDLIFCRDVLFHYEDSLITRALRNIKRSGAKYLMTTTFIDLKRNQEIEATGLFRKINLQIAPFNFGDPIEMVMEKEPGKAMGLWAIESLPDY